MTTYYPVSNLSIQYDRNLNQYLKFYSVNTTVPFLMSTDAVGTELIDKAQINNEGFITSDGSSVFIPHLNNPYDAWLFPNAADADANNTANAVKIASNQDVTNSGKWTYKFDTVTETVNSTSVGIGDTVIIKERNSSLWDVVSSVTVTPNGFDVIASASKPSIAFVLRVDIPVVYISSLGAVSGVEIAPYIRRAQEILVAKGGGKLVIDIAGEVIMSEGLTVDPLYADYVIDVESNMEITASPNLRIVGDKTKGGDVAGYCLFHINGKSNIKIHGFNDIDGDDHTTIKGIGQIVAIRGDGSTVSKNIDVYDIHVKNIRDEPFRLGQTTFAGQIADNVNIWNVSVDGCSSHGVVMRSLSNSSASGLHISNAGRLGIDMSSYNVNCHLHGGRGHNIFINTTGGFKIDGGAGKDEFTLSTFNCSASDVYYDGSTNGSQSVNGYLFRVMCKNAVVRNVKGFNCGGAGINLLTAGDVSEDNMNILLENILIDTVTNGDSSSSSFDGKSMLIKHDSINDLGVTFKNVEIRNTVATGKIDASGVKGSLLLDNADTFIYNNNTSGNTKNINLELGLKDSVFNIVNDATNGGSDNVSIYLKDFFSGDSELDIEGSTKVVVSGNAYIESTRTRQIRFDNCTDYHISDLSGEGTSMVWIAGTMNRGIATGLIGNYSDGLIFESGSTTYTANKGLYANCINSGSGGYVISSTATASNLL